MKKSIKFIFITILIFLLCLTSCGKKGKTVTITVIDGSGSGTYKIGKEVSIFAETVTGETFVGWLVDGGLVSTANPYKFEAEKDLTITAQIKGRKHEVVDYKISYILDGGISDNPTTYNENTRTFSLNNPTKDGYIFKGWTGEGLVKPTKDVTITRGSKGDKTFTAVWEKYSKPEKFQTLRVGIFADVQLTSLNHGSTANAYISLVHHLEYCKNQNVDVLFMNGDIVNNAVLSYYKLFDKALKQVYGTDESKYPEFVWNMGNHEWWDESENNTGVALQYYYDYARVESPNLVKRSSVKYALNNDYTLPSYYKVINGVPFVVISGSSSDGNIPQDLRSEIEGWLEEIEELEYVKAGGPIFVGYHCSLPGVSYFGQGAGQKASTVIDLFKNIPNAIVFTSDTHYPSTNERTINQVDFTTINIGSSSYSRMVSHSATYKTSMYANLQATTGGKSAEIMVGESQYLYEYGENIMIADFLEDGTTKICRYLTNNKEDGREEHIGHDWELPLITSKDDFIYTDDRFENKEWANKMYGKDGLTWNDGEVVKFNVEDGKMVVAFNDVTDHNYCEHYLVEVTLDDDSIKKYDFVSSYYKWETESHYNHFIVYDLPESTTYKVKVTAYDYFDNPSLNTLTTESVDTSTSIGEKIDLTFAESYSDISRKVNYSVVTPGSKSSVEYYYQGINPFNNGAFLGRLYYKNTEISCKDCLSCTDWTKAVLMVRVKNVNNFDLSIGPTVVLYDESGAEQWKTDFGREYQQVIKANSDWTLVTWDLSKLFGVKNYNKISHMGLKISAAESSRDGENGYCFHFYIDDLDIVNEDSVKLLSNEVDKSVLYLSQINYVFLDDLKSFENCYY